MNGSINSASDGPVTEICLSCGSTQHLYKASVHVLAHVFLPLIQEGQLSVTGESMCTKYWFTA